MKFIANSLLICLLLTNSSYASNEGYRRIIQEVNTDVQKKVPQANELIKDIAHAIEIGQPTNITEELNTLNKLERVALTGALVQQLDKMLESNPESGHVIPASILGIAGFSTILIGIAEFLSPQDGKSQKWRYFWDKHAGHVVFVGIALMLAGLALMEHGENSSREDEWKEVSFIKLRDKLKEKYEADLRALVRERLTVN